MKVLLGIIRCYFSIKKQFIVRTIKWCIALKKSSLVIQIPNILVLKKSLQGPALKKSLEKSQIIQCIDCLKKKFENCAQREFH